MGYSDTFNNRHIIWRKAEKQTGGSYITPIRKKRHAVKLEKSSKKSKNYHSKRDYREPT